MARMSPIRGELERDLRREFTTRGRRALAIYTKTPLRKDRSGYPFKAHPEDGSIRSKKSQSIRPIPGGIRIAVESRGAPFIEEGNDAGGRFIRAANGKMLAIPLKGGRKNKAAGRVFFGQDGRPYLAVQRVRSYKGRHLLERSVRIAFTGRSGL